MLSEGALDLQKATSRRASDADVTLIHCRALSYTSGSLFWAARSGLRRILIGRGRTGCK